MKLTFEIESNDEIYYEIDNKIDYEILYHENGFIS